MAKTNNIIEINGQRYDAVTGAAIVPSHLASSTQTIDGIVAGSKPKVALAELTKPSPKPVSITAKPVMSDVVGTVKPKIARPAPVVAPSHKPEAGKTLMRHAVHKPDSSFKRRVKAQGAQSVALRQPSQVVAAKQAVQVVDTDRLARAKQTPHSQHIKRFHRQPVALQSPHLIAPSVQLQPVAVAKSAAAQQPAHQAMFEKALQQATSHQQPPVATEKEQRRRRISKRLLSVTAGSFAALALIGFGVAQNWSNISVHLAASRAGFAASLPNYQPSGYSVGKITTSTGTVAVHFASNSSDSRNYTLTEKVSDWDSQTLRDMFVASASDDSYQTTQASGQTIYLYGNRTATWVNAGIWYTITSNGSLSDNQLLNLASSL